MNIYQPQPLGEPRLNVKPVQSGRGWKIWISQNNEVCDVVFLQIDKKLNYITSLDWILQPSVIIFQPYCCEIVGLASLSKEGQNDFNH